MWWLKCMGSLLIMGGCGYIGWNQSFLLRKRIRLLKEMIDSLLVFKSLTGTYKLPLNVVFYRISQRSMGPISRFYGHLAENFNRMESPEGELLWQQTVEEEKDLFKAGDRELIKGLGNFIGISDSSIQKTAVDDCIQAIRERVHGLEAEQPAKEKLYRVLALTAGGFLVILLF